MSLGEVSYKGLDSRSSDCSVWSGPCACSVLCDPCTFSICSEPFSCTVGSDTGAFSVWSDPDAWFGVGEVIMIIYTYVQGSRRGLYMGDISTGGWH